MKVFVSSLIAGMEPLRTAVRAAIETLGHEAIMAEDFGAEPRSPQVACLDGVRRSAVVILILGSRYGAKQASGLSATHEEYREARETRPVLAFVEERVNSEPDQEAFIREVQGWKSGLFRAAFSNPETLQAGVIGALHRHELASATAPFDGRAILVRALSYCEIDRRQSSYERSQLVIAVAGGPDQAILRPSQIEDVSLAEKLEQEALYGSVRLFTRGEAAQADVVDGRLVLNQIGREKRSITLDAQGGIVVEQPVEVRDPHGMMSSVILVEVLEERITAALRYAAWLLEAVDPTQRLSHVVLAARITGGFAMLTKREYEAHPRSIAMSGYGKDNRPPVHLSPAHMPRAALSQQLDQLVSDLATLLRRQWR